MMKARVLLFLCFTVASRAAVIPAQTLASPAQVELRGVLGTAISASAEKRLKVFIQDETSEPIALFRPERAEQNADGRYWGEHAGKWLFAASRAAVRSHDEKLAQRVRRVANFLISTQGADGYIGTYPKEWRFMNRQRELTRGRWDVWVTAYVMMGLMEVNRNFPDARYVEAARRLGDLCCRTFIDDGRDITELSNHDGLSATILLEPVADLYGLTSEPRYLALAHNIIHRADARPDFDLTGKSVAGADVQTIAGGKAYQLCWQFFGVAKLYRVTGDPQYLRMAENFWENVRQHHLTLAGGPWGGIGVHREVFNPQDFFSPFGFVETCSIMAWIQLNRELLSLTGEPCYAEEIERAAYNALLGAQDENGADWCYYSFPNGKRVNTSEWKCCKSSGAMALEELGPAAYAVRSHGDLVVNLYSPGRTTLVSPVVGSVQLEQITDYPFQGGVRLILNPDREMNFVLALRIPSWAKGATATINGTSIEAPVSPGKYLEVSRAWKPRDEIVLNFPMIPALHRRSSVSLQDTNLRENGKKVMQTVMRYDYAAITRGPLVYATGLIDGFKQEETLRLPSDEQALSEEIPGANAQEPPGISLHAEARAPLLFLPYYLTGGRHDNAWRLTWMQIASE